MITQENISYTADEIKAMVKTCEKYNKALERAKDILTYKEVRREDMEYLFPELKESEDEKIKREIRNYIWGSPDKLPERTKWLAWLEKQGKQKTDSCTDCTNDKGCVTCENGNMKETKSELKFHPGDWVILNDTVAQIFDKQKYGFVGLDIDGKDFFCNYGHTNSMRLWSIEDAREGDVLVNSKGQPFIFSGKYDDRNFGNPIAYCGLNYQNKFKISSGTYWTNKREVAPATKEQCELLFQKMKEDGYEWDTEKKELRKMKEVNEDEMIKNDIIRVFKGEISFTSKKANEKYIAWLEKQGGQKPADNIKPKFHPGDWIIDNIGNIYQIEKVFETITKDIFGYITVDGVYFNDNNDLRLWTIADAKDGDILYLQHKGAEHIIIYKKFIKKNFHTILSVHCAYDGSTNDFFEDCDSYYCITSERDEKEIHPATKEQCDTLFAKMKEAGYEWDNNKKKLNKK